MLTDYDHFLLYTSLFGSGAIDDSQVTHIDCLQEGLAHSHKSHSEKLKPSFFQIMLFLLKGA